MAYFVASYTVMYSIVLYYNVSYNNVLYCMLSFAVLALRDYSVQLVLILFILYALPIVCGIFNYILYFVFW